MSQCIKEYYLDVYKKQQIAKIVKIDDDKVYLDKTIFYPEGGGQPGDRGFINNYKIVDTQKEGESISHIVEKPFDLKVGEEILLKLDWNHRYQYMKMHTAQHLISGILHSTFDVTTVSVHQGSQLLTIEIDNSNFSEESCYKVEDLANEKILEALDISYSQMDIKEAQKLNLRRSIKVDGLIRIVKIDKVDLIACGGLHVNNTSEIERVMFCGIERIRKHYRLIFKVSKNVVKTIREFDSIIKELCVLHSSTVESLVDCNKALIERNLELERQLRYIQKENANLLLTSIVEKSENKIIVQDISKYNIDFKNIDLNVDKAILLYKEDEVDLKWFIYLGPSFEKFNINDIRKDVLSVINGKGGGRYPTFQGKGDKNNIQQCKEAFLGYFNERE